MHVLIVGHVLHWWITGRSIGRFVLSDSMRTLELGEINPGFLFFGLALLATAIVGRFMCGWLCHVGALQDLSAWMLRRIGIRPHLFRSRILGLVPLGLAAYMFIWPTFKREVLAPLLRPAWPGVDAALAVAPFPGFTISLTTERLWDGLPSLWVAIPFLLICGFAIVFFLGARGLCRYACPYGGFLLPAEQVAMARVVVDPSRCDQCGLCTAICSAGVRVHDEVRVHGAVLDRNCIRSIDCVGACPSAALSFRFTAPAAGRGGSAVPHAQRYDLTWTEEIVCLGVFLGAFVILRGLYEAIPLLMAAPMAVIVAYLAWKSMRLDRDPNVTFARMQLRRAGRITRRGVGFEAAVLLLGLLLVHSAVVRGLNWRAERIDDRVTVSLQAALEQRGVTDDDRANASAALRLYRLAGPWSGGGIGLARTPSASVRTAWLEIVLGRPEAACAELAALIDSGRANDAVRAQYEMVRALIDGNRDSHGGPRVGGR